MIKISISPKQLVTALSLIVVFLVFAHVVGLIFRFGFGHPSVYTLVPLFDLNIEKNVPTFYSSLTLLLSAWLLLVIAMEKLASHQPFAKHWLMLALIFLYLSCDEIMVIHERLIVPVGEYLDATGVAYFAWVIPYGIAVIVFVIAFIPFLLALPRRFRRIFIAAGTIYVTGAIVFESLSAGVYFETKSPDTPLFVLLYSVEETLEMTGIVIFIYGLSSYIAAEMNGLQIVLDESGDTSRVAFEDRELHANDASEQGKDLG